MRTISFCRFYPHCNSRCDHLCYCASELNHLWEALQLVWLARKRKVCTGHRASTTRILGQVDPVVTTEPLDVPKITQLRRSLKDKLTSLTALDIEILPGGSRNCQIDEIIGQVYAALSKLKVALKPNTAEHTPADPTPVLTPRPPEEGDDCYAPPPTRGQSEAPQDQSALLWW